MISTPAYSICLRFACIALSIPLLTACAGVTRTALKPEITANIHSVKSQLFIPADELIVRAKPSNISPAMGYGLLPALIDASISSSRQTELEAVSNPYYAKTDQIDFRSTFMTAFNGAIAEQKTLPAISPSMSTRGISNSALTAYKAELHAGEAFLGIRIWYEFSTDLRNVMVSATALLAGKEGQEPLYKNSYTYVSAPVDSVNPLTAWSDKDGQALQKVYIDSGKEIARLMQQDLAGPANETLFAELAKQEKVQFTLATAMPMVIKGFTIEQSTQRKTIRAESGELFSLSK